MKQRPPKSQSSIRPLISKHEVVHHTEVTRLAYDHPWNQHLRKWDAEKHKDNKLKKPNTPTAEAIKKAKFVDKTYQWKTNQ